MTRIGAAIGGQVLWSDAASPARGDVVWHGDRLVDRGAAAPTDADVIDATGCLVLPGLVDLHGDAFERSVMPRGGVAVDLGIAMADNADQLLGSGITTSYLSATDSWEPGLRSRRMLLRLVDALDAGVPGPKVELHVRHERCATDDLTDLVELIERGRVTLLSYNDHTPGGIVHITGISPSMLARSGVELQRLEEIQEAAVGRRPLGRQQERHLAAACGRANCPTASHDAADEQDLERDLDLGVDIAEFPISAELAQAYRDEGIWVLLGAPNLVRGGSHLGNLSVKDAFRPGDVLCSDYHYPSLLQAPFVIEREGLGSFAEGWRACSTSAADAVGRSDIGRIEEGAAADLVVVEPPADGRPARVKAVVVDGEIVRHAV